MKKSINVLALASIVATIGFYWKQLRPDSTHGRTSTESISDGSSSDSRTSDPGDTQSPVASDERSQVGKDSNEPANNGESEVESEAQRVSTAPESEKARAALESLQRLRKDDLASRLNFVNTLDTLLPQDPHGRQAIVLSEFDPEQWNSVPAPPEWKRQYALSLARVYFESGIDSHSVEAFEAAVTRLPSDEIQEALRTAKAQLLLRLAPEPETSESN